MYLALRLRNFLATIKILTKILKFSVGSKARSHCIVTKFMFELMKVYVKCDYIV